MSLYSGFVSNKYENFYDRLTFKLVELLQDVLLTTVSPALFENSIFSKKVLKIHKALRKLEENRYNHSKDVNVSNAFEKLATSIREIFQNNSFEMSENSILESKRSVPAISE